MTIRCGCPDEGDEIVFGPVHQCTRDTEGPHYVKPRQRAECDLTWPPARPYEHVLSDDELEG